MCQTAEVFTKLGVTAVTGTTLARSCSRYDNVHCLNTEESRSFFVKYFANVAYHCWVLSGVDALRKDANLFAKPRGEKTQKRIDSGYLDTSSSVIGTTADFPVKSDRLPLTRRTGGSSP